MMTRFRNLVQRNLPAKIVSILAAVVLWSFVMNEQNPVIDGSFTVQIQLVNAPDGYKITQETKSAKMKVRGVRSLFINVSEKDFKAYADLSDVTSGKNSIPIKTVLPQGFELVEVEPDSVSIVAEKLVSKVFRVELAETGTLAPNRTVAHISTPLEQVTASGTEAAVKEIVRVVGYVRLGENSEDFTQKVSLVALNQEGREVQGVTLSPEQASVSVQLARGLSKKVVAILPVAGTDLDKTLSVSSLRADPSKVEIAGPEDAIKGISVIETEKISLSDVKKTMDKTVKLHLPDGVTVTNPEVTVHIEVKDKKKE